MYSDEGEMEHSLALPIGTRVWCAGRRGTIIGHTVVPGDHGDPPYGHVLNVMRFDAGYGAYLAQVEEGEEKFGQWYIGTALVDSSAVDVISMPEIRAH